MAPLVWRRRYLEQLLEQVPPHPAPRIELEQYTTPAPLVAHIVWVAETVYGDITGRRVLDLGCGTGRFSLAALLLGAEEVLAVDIDPRALSIAREVVPHLYREVTGEEPHLHLLCTDVKLLEVRRKFDTVLQNPPFGHHRPGADTEFLVKALQVSDVVYTMHKTSTRRYVLNLIEKYNFRAQVLFTVEYPIPPMFPHHRERKHIVLVDVIRAERC